MADYSEVFKTGTFEERYNTLTLVAQLPPDQRPGALNKCYDAWVTNGYEEDILSNGYVSHINLAKEISSRLDDKSSRLLDCASGSGLHGLELKSLGFANIDALDSSQVSLDESRGKNVYTNFICAFLGPERLPIEDDQYDCICLTGAFGSGHVFPDCLPEWVRITKSGGFIMFVVREENLIRIQGFCDGVLDAIIHKMADKGCWEFLEKRRMLYFKGTGTVPGTQYSYLYVLKVL